MSKEVLLKLGVYGEGGVGKTSLVNAFFGKEVPNDYSPTFNSKITKKDYSLKKTGVVFKINVWDVGGNRNINPTINTAFFTDVDLALLVFDLTDPEKTLKTHKKNFLDKLMRYSEEPLTLMVGNKLDKLSLNARFKKAIKDFLGENTRFSIISVKSDVNVNDCIELLIYTYLKKGEILTPDIVPENSSSEFLEKIGKNEKRLQNQLVNLSKIESKFREIKSSVKFVDEPKREDKKEKYQEFIQKELKKISVQKKTVVDKFSKNVVDLGKKINQLKKENIKSAVELVEKLVSSLENSKKDSEQNLEALLKLNREENELMIISTKSRAVKAESVPKVKATPAKVKEVKVEAASKLKATSVKVEEVKVEAAFKVKATPAKVKEVKVEAASKIKATPAKVEEVKVEAAPKVKATPAKVKEVKVEAAPKEKATSAKVKEVKVEAAPKVKVTPAKVKEVKVEAAPKLKATPATVKEVKVEAVPKVKATPAKVKEVKVDSASKIKATPAKVEEVKVEAAPKVKATPAKVKEVKVEAAPKVKATPAKVKEVKVEAAPKLKATPATVKEVKVEAVPKVKATPAKVKEVKVEAAPKVKATPAKVKEVKVKVAPKVKPSPPKLKKVKIGSTPIKKDPKIELYNKYERENPGKRAVYRGKETKGFLTWKDQINN